MKRFYFLTIVAALMMSYTAQAQEITDPRFPGCEEKENELDKLDCAEMKMLQFVFSNLHHPDAAKAAGVSGMVEAKFTISAKGEVKNPTIVVGLGSGCDEEVIRIISMMPPWIPGEEDGTPKDMEYSIKVKFTK